MLTGNFAELFLHIQRANKLIFISNVKDLQWFRWVKILSDTTLNKKSVLFILPCFPLFWFVLGLCPKPELTSGSELKDLSGKGLKDHMVLNLGWLSIDKCLALLTISPHYYNLNNIIYF